MWAQLSENMHLSFSRRTYHARVAFLYHVARGLLDFGVRYFTVTWFLVSPRTCYLLDTKTGMYSVKRDLL